MIKEEIQAPKRLIKRFKLKILKGVSFGTNPKSKTKIKIIVINVEIAAP